MRKRKRCNRIPSDITIGRNYAAWGYYNFSLKMISLKHIKTAAYFMIIIKFSSKDLSSFISISFAYKDG